MQGISCPATYRNTLFRVDERSSDSYIDADDFLFFFCGKSLEICLGSNLLFRGIKIAVNLIKKVP